MKFTKSISTLSVILPLIASVHAVSVPGGHHIARAQNNKFGGFGGNKGNQNQNKGNQNQNNNKGGNNNNGQAASSAAANTGAAVSNTVIATGTVANTNTAASSTSTSASGSNNNNSGDIQSSLTLDPSVIASGFAQDGQSQPTAGQIASATSTDNFINFCATVPNLPITNGKQITTGSCNPAPMGILPSTSNMPSAKFEFPQNFGTVPANQAFTVTLNTANIELGNFVNAQLNYFAGPQTVNGQGNIVGHTHIVIEQLQSLQQTTPTNPQDFAFFKGVDDAGNGQGTVTVPVSAGVPPGAYRICSINTSSNHVPVAVPVAQHGGLDDCSYFTATVGGASASNSTAASGAANSGAAANNNANSGAAANNNAGSAANTGAANTGAANNNAGSAANSGAANNNAGSAANTGANANNGAAAKNTGAANTGANNGAAAKNTGAANNGAAAKNTGAANNGAAAKNTGAANTGAASKNTQQSQAAQAAAANQAAQAAAAQKAAQNNKGKGKRGFQLNGRSGLRTARHA